MPLYRRLPKRGFTNINSKNIVGINVSALERFDNDAVVTVEELLAAGEMCIRDSHMGIRPTVRGSVMNPNDHPHGGGEGKTGIGRPGPSTPWGKPALGLKTRKKDVYKRQALEGFIPALWSFVMQKYTMGSQASHLPDAPQGRTRPFLATGSPTSSAFTCPPNVGTISVPII